MLENATIKVFIPTVKPQEAKVFYSGVLGFKLLSEDNYAMEFDANGTLLRVNRVPELKPHTFTVLGWKVPDIATAIQALRDKGVQCEKYDFIEQDNLGIWTAPGGTKVAWFKDPDGNILSMDQ